MLASTRRGAHRTGWRAAFAFPRPFTETVRVPPDPTSPLRASESRSPELPPAAQPPLRVPQTPSADTARPSPRTGRRGNSPAWSAEAGVSLVLAAGRLAASWVRRGFGTLAPRARTSVVQMGPRQPAEALRGPRHAVSGCGMFGPGCLGGAYPWRGDAIAAGSL